MPVTSAQPPIAPRRRRLRFHTIKQAHKTPFWSRIAKSHLNYISKNKCTVTEPIKHETSVPVVMGEGRKGREGGRARVTGVAGGKGTGDAAVCHPTLDPSTNTSSYTRGVYRRPSPHRFSASVSTRVVARNVQVARLCSSFSLVVLPSPGPSNPIPAHPLPPCVVSDQYLYKYLRC